MGLYNRVTPTASSAVINGTVGAPATAKLRGRSPEPGPQPDLFGSQLASETLGLPPWIRTLGVGMACFSPVASPHPGQVT